MTTREERIAELDEQRRCLEELTEDDIGCDVWVRDYMDYPWSGPYSFAGFGMGRLMFGANEACWAFATKTPPIEPQKITLHRWNAGQCPVGADVFVGVRLRNGKIIIGQSATLSHRQWEHSNEMSESTWITHYAPIEIEVEE